MPFFKVCRTAIKTERSISLLKDLIIDLIAIYKLIACLFCALSCEHRDCELFLKLLPILS